MDSAEEVEKHIKSKMGFEEDGQISYSLRENPKKSWKFPSFDHVTASSSSSSMQENQCKVCGKNFESLKALFGHMRHHSGRGRTRIPCKECAKSFLSLKSLANHMRSHSLSHSHKSRVSDESGTCSRLDLAVKKSLCVKKKRSRRKRYNLCTTSSISSFNESLSVTEIDQEVDMAARCLMMLSMGVGKRGGLDLHSLIEFSSDNDSLTLNDNDSECFKSEKTMMVLYEKREDQCVELCSEIEKKKKKIDLELEVSLERFYSGGGDKGIASEMKLLPISEDLVKEVELSKKVNFDVCDDEFETGDCEFKCVTCKRMFGSRRALAGHQRMHGTKRQEPEFEAGGCKFVKLECLGNSMKLKKGKSKKQHKCPICLKDFATIQALGGHKKVHMVKKNSKSRPRKTAIIKQEDSEICDELDLDLSIPILPGEEGSKPQWPYKPVVSLVA